MGRRRIHRFEEVLPGDETSYLSITGRRYRSVVLTVFPGHARLKSGEVLTRDTMANTHPHTEPMKVWRWDDT